MSHKGMKEVALNFIPIVLACGTAVALLLYLSNTNVLGPLLRGGTTDSPTPSPFN